MKESGISIMIQERIVLQGKSIAQVAQETGNVKEHRSQVSS
jgi:hypothetical protein